MTQRATINDWKPKPQDVEKMANSLMHQFADGKNQIQNILKMLKSLKLNDQYSVYDFKMMFDRKHDGKIEQSDLYLFCQISIKADYLFQYYNKGNNEQIQGEDLDVLLKKMGHKTKQDRERFLKIIDTDGNKKISHSEFYHVCKIRVLVDYIFKTYCKPEKQILTPRIIQKILGKLKLVDPINLPQIQQCDVDGSKTLDKMETFNYINMYLQKHKNYELPYVPKPPKRA